MNQYFKMRLNVTDSKHCQIPNYKKVHKLMQGGYWKFLVSLFSLKRFCLVALSFVFYAAIIQ